MSAPVLAFLIMDDGPRLTCVGCSQRLVEKGLLRLLFESPLSAISAEKIGYYVIADDYTLEDCRKAIRDRHVGKAWGS